MRWWEWASLVGLLTGAVYVLLVEPITGWLEHGRRRSR